MKLGEHRAQKGRKSQGLDRGNDVAVVIPARNEEKRIVGVIRGARKYSKNVIVVDDGSTDGTGRISEKEGALVLRHDANLGKGVALKTGCDFAVKNGAKKIVVIDADGQHNPEDIPVFLEKLEGCDIVFGARKFDENMPLVQKFGNGLINKITRLLYGVKIRDCLCGFRAFTSSAYSKLRWTASDYSMESEMAVNACRHKLRYKEVAIDTSYSKKYGGTSIFDGFKIVADLFYWKLRGKD